MSERTELIGTHGVEIARIDDTTYLALHAVYACQDGQPPLLYCCWSDWPTTQVARLFGLICVNSDLAARVVALEKELRALAEIAKSAPENGRIPCDHPGCLDWIKPRSLAAHKRQAHGIGILGTVSTPALDERRKCPHCTARPKIRGLEAHIDRAHPTRAVPTPTIARMELANDLGWRCAAKGCTGAFTRDLHDPAFCTHHAAPRTNGHEQAVRHDA